MASITFSTTNNFTFFNTGKIPLPPIIEKGQPPVVLRQLGHFKRSYTLLEKLGEGSHAVVWKVLLPRRNVAALKIHIPGRAYWYESRREAGWLKALQNAPHVLRYRADFDLAPASQREEDQNLSIHQIKKESRQHAILMDLLPCPNAYKMFIQPVKSGETTRLSVHQVRIIGGQVLELLQNLRFKKIVYGDLKPENMAYDESTQKVTIYDFGFAERVDRVNSSTVVQTRPYRAPERLLFKPYDESINMWSLGAALFEFYTGIQLFPVPGEDDNIQTTIDHFHMMIHILGKGPSLEFITSALPDYSRLFLSDGSLAFPPSDEGRVVMDYYTQIREQYLEIPLWQAHIYEAAKCKGEGTSDAARLIALIDPMLSYENRILPEDALRQFFSPIH